MARDAGESFVAKACSVGTAGAMPVARVLGPSRALFGAVCPVYEIASLGFGV